MDRAINKSTGEIVSAFEIFKNGSYQNLTKGEWIAPKDSIYNYEECNEEDLYLHYVKEKEYKNWKHTFIWCSPHFSIYPNSKAKTVEESSTHKKLKNWLFNRLKNDDLLLIYSKGVKPHKYINKIKLSELDINWKDYSVEVTTKGTRRLRADILLPFNKKHLFLGEGIFFEIQISNQSEEQTYERSINRALHGYSICWLFDKDFIIEEDNIELLNNEIKINSFSEQIHFAKKGFVKKLKYVVEEQCRYLDKKINETEIIIDKLEIIKENIYQDILSRLNTREAILFKKIENLEDNPFKGLIDNYKEQLNNHSSILIDKIEYIGDDKLSKINSSIPQIITCPKCGSSMKFKITMKQQKELYECINCKYVEWLK